MSESEMQAELERLRAENAQLKSKDKGGLTLKVSEKGGVSLYGMGRFPVTLYKEQWLRILGPAHCPNHCSMPGTTPCCFARSRLCGGMFPSLIRFSLFVGQGRVPTLRNTAID
jgi:hypothetical protein